MFHQRSSKQVLATKSTYNHLILDQNIYSIEMEKKSYFKASTIPILIRFCDVNPP